MSADWLHCDDCHVWFHPETGVEIADGDMPEELKPDDHG